MRRVRYTLLLGLSVIYCLINDCSARLKGQRAPPTPPNGHPHSICWNDFGSEHDEWCPATTTPYCQAEVRRAGCGSCNNFRFMKGTIWNQNEDYCNQRLQQSTIAEVVEAARNPLARTNCEANTGRCYIQVQENVECEGFPYRNANLNNNQAGPELRIRWDHVDNRGQEVRVTGHMHLGATGRNINSMQQGFTAQIKRIDRTHYDSNNSPIVAQRDRDEVPMDRYGNVHPDVPEGQRLRRKMFGTLGRWERNLWEKCRVAVNRDGRWAWGSGQQVRNSFFTHSSRPVTVPDKIIYF